MAVVATASIELLRTSQSAWNRHQSDQLRRRTAAAALRHVVRAARQAAAVSAISAATDNSGALSLLRADGTTLVWDHDGGSNEIRYGEGAAAALLAENITGMTLVGLLMNVLIKGKGVFTVWPKAMNPFINAEINQRRRRDADGRPELDPRDSLHRNLQRRPARGFGCRADFDARLAPESVAR